MTWRAMKHFCSEPPQYGLNVPADEYGASGLRLLRTSDISEDGGLDSRSDPVFVPTALARDIHRVQDGDLLFSRSGTLGRCLRVTPEIGDATFAGFLVRFRPRPGTDPRFIEYCSRSRFFQEVIKAEAISSTISNFNAERYANIALPWWEPSEQRAVADFLDVETARIDALITKKRRVLELLDQRDVGLGHEMITGQIIDGPRRPSPTEWLRDLPAEWPLAPVASQFHVVLGRMLNAERAAAGDMRPYVRNINVRWDTVDMTNVDQMDFPRSERAKYALRPGDLLINEGGAGIGRSAIWHGEIPECYFQKSVLRLRPIGHSRPRWMIECMRVAVDRKVFLVEGNLATIPHVPAEALRVHRFPFPPTIVQDELLEWLDAQRESNRHLRTAIGRQLDLLVEHRQALITAAVTGEMSVPGVAA